jgi:hypothetical protein
MHGYVAFDPLREVYFARGKDAGPDGSPNLRPLDLVRQALTQHGFILETAVSDLLPTENRAFSMA